MDNIYHLQYYRVSYLCYHLQMEDLFLIFLNNNLHPAQEKYKITPIDQISALCPS